MTLEELLRDSDWQTIFDEPYGWDDTEPKSSRNYGVSDTCHNPHNPLTREPAGRDYKLADVRAVIAVSEGEKDEREWLGLFETTDGRFLFVSAGCDYTGWDCQSSGHSEWTSTLAEAIACIPQGDRERLGLVKP